MSQGTEAFLAGCVPNLDLHLLIGAFRREDLLSVIKTERCHVLGVEFSFSVLVKQASLANAAITEHDNVKFDLSHSFYILLIITFFLNSFYFYNLIMIQC